MKPFLLSLSAAVVLITFCALKQRAGVLPEGHAPATQPNIVIIMADDMGFSDIGCYGSEIPTPNIDALAKGGVRMTQFYNNARCCPTRASLLTGLYPGQPAHRALPAPGRHRRDGRRPGEPHHQR